MRKVVAGALAACALSWAQGAAAGDAAKDKKHTVFEGKKNFGVDGKIEKVSQDTVTIQRKDLPPVTRHVSSGTKVEKDGKQVGVGQLAPGEDVKASFNLSGSTPEAVEIKAKRTRAEKSEGRRQEGQRRSGNPPSSGMPSPLVK